MTDDRYEQTLGGAAPGSSTPTPAEATHAATQTGAPDSSTSGWTTSSATATSASGPEPRVPPGYTSYRGYGSPQVPPRPADTPSPGLAALLGLIPGVGAMYNGQFAKGLAHLAIFAVLVSLADNVNGIFGVFVAGWVFYQSFEAYHTARARRDGLPLPNAFGLNDIGERLGFGKNWPNFSSSPQTTGNQSSAAAPPSSPSPAGVSPTWSQAQPYSPSAPYTIPPYAQPPAPSSANWAGYVPPEVFAQAPPPSYPYSGTSVPPTNVPPVSTSNWNSVPFTPTASGPTGSVTPLPTVPIRRFPVGAVLLIGLGAIFLISNIAPAWRLGERWLVPLLLAASAIWALVRRLGIPYGKSTPILRGGALICALRLPVVLFVLALMFTFQAVGWLTIGQSWPLLLIVLGALLLLERTLGRMARTASVPLEAVAPSADYVEGGAR